MRRSLLALAVSAHLAVIALQAFPSPAGGVNRAAWRDPAVQAELQTWAARMGLSPRALEERLWTLSTGWAQLRYDVLRPFWAYYRFAGTAQSWKMFVAPHTFPTRLQIEVRREGNGWERVYLERSPDARWLAGTLSNDRLRATIFRMGWPQYAELRRDFSAWVAEQAARDLPDARQVRISFLKERTRSPHEVRAGVSPPESAPIFVTMALVPR